MVVHPLCGRRDLPSSKFSLPYGLPILRPWRSHPDFAPPHDSFQPPLAGVRSIGGLGLKAALVRGHMWPAIVHGPPRFSPQRFLRLRGVPPFVPPWPGPSGPPLSARVRDPPFHLQRISFFSRLGSAKSPSSFQVSPRGVEGTYSTIC